MAAVADQRSRFQVLANSFADRASKFINSELLHLTDKPIEAVNLLQGAH